MCNIFCNIPHSGVVIPDWAMKDIIISDVELAMLIDFMVDKNVDKIWDFVPVENKEVATMSRLILDTERFRSDEDEIMASKGMGLYYTHTPDGKQFRVKSEDSYTNCLSVYDAYHKSLENKVTLCLESYDKCIFLDCHSFHDEMYYTEYSPATFPDVCIGVNGSISDEAQLIIDIFRKNGYSVKVNEPFAGSLVPLKYLNDNRVIPIMIELNRRIYVDNIVKVSNLCKDIYNNLLRGTK